MHPDNCGVEWDDYISISARNAAVDAALDPVCLRCCSSALLSDVQLFVPQDPQLPLSKAAPPPHRSQPVFVSLVTSFQVQDLALVFAKIHAVLSCLPFQPTRVFL